MLSFLLGSPAPPWYDLKEMFEEHRNVAVYTDSNGNIVMIKVSDIDEFFFPTTVLAHPAYLRRLKVYYLKMAKYVAFPIFSLNALRKLVENKNWRAMEFYVQEEFVGGWVLYDCEGEKCEGKQISHLAINPFSSDSEVIASHLKIYYDT